MDRETGTYLRKRSATKDLDEVKTFWTQNANTTQFWTGDPQNIGSADFFSTIGEFIKKHYAHRYRLIDTYAAKYPNGMILEVGCGAGWELVAWAKHGLGVTGLDLSKSALDLTVENLRHNNIRANVIQADAEQLPFRNNAFHIVASFGVLHHTATIQNALDDLRRILKHEGIAIVTLYYKYSWKIMLAKLSNINFEFSHEDSPVTRLYGKKDLNTLFKDFDEVRICLDYLDATQTPRKGFLAVIFNSIFVPLYNTLPVGFRKRFGHTAVIVAKKRNQALGGTTFAYEVGVKNVLTSKQAREAGIGEICPDK